MGTKREGLAQAAWAFKDKERPKAKSRFVPLTSRVGLTPVKAFSADVNVASSFKHMYRAVDYSTNPYSCDTTGNSKTTSFPVRRRYTDENESSVYSSEVASFE